MEFAARRYIITADGIRYDSIQYCVFNVQ